MAKPVTIAPTPERHRHDTIVEVPTDKAGVVAHQVQFAHALERYHKRKELAKDARENDRRYDAGCKLREAYELANVEPNVIGAYREMISAGSVSVQHLRIGAYEAWRRAVRAIGPVASNEVIDVCCMGETLRDRARMEILRRGLAVLADHYGLRA